MFRKFLLSPNTKKDAFEICDITVATSAGVLTRNYKNLTLTFIYSYGKKRLIIKLEK